ncbi:MAG TPA: hypothetical protein VKS20_03125 [Candidatus Acidoferrales bacterium]|nr:hypothetical protein [Candidatus Acidoferrales bacterium]
MPGLNYFNYFTEIEEHFWRKRGAHLLVSPLDWAILETWQKSEIPLEAVLRGIDRAFESYSRSRRGSGGRPLKSLAYCVDAVLEAAQEMQEAAAGAGPQVSGKDSAKEPFSHDELRHFLEDRRMRLLASAEKHGAASPHLAQQLSEVAGFIPTLKTLLDSPAKLDYEDFERRLTVLEDKIVAALNAAVDPDTMLGIRREMDHALAPYRRKMSAEQLATIERQYIQKRLFEVFGLSRLSLYYLK